MTRKLTKSIKFKQAPTRVTAGNVLARKTGSIYTDSDSGFVSANDSENPGGGVRMAQPLSQPAAMAQPPQMAHTSSKPMLSVSKLSKFAGRTGVVEQSQFQSAEGQEQAQQQPPQPTGQQPPQPLYKPAGLVALGQPIHGSQSPTMQGQLINRPQAVGLQRPQGVPLQQQPPGRTLALAPSSYGRPTMVGQSTMFNQPPIEQQAPQGQQAPQVQSVGAAATNIIESITDQMRDYVEVCESLMDMAWTPQDIIDNINLLIRDMNFDVVTMVLADDETPNKFSPPVSRGYRTPPGSNVMQCWEQAFGGTINLDWEQLLKTTCDKDTELAAWIVKEDVKSFAYVPICDQEAIYGFLFIGSRKPIKLPPVSTNIIELCGSRIGLTLAARSGAGRWPDLILESVKEIKTQFSIIMGNIEMAMESDAVTLDEMKAALLECSTATQVCMGLIDELSNAAAAPPDTPE